MRLSRRSALLLRLAVAVSDRVQGQRQQHVDREAPVAAADRQQRAVANVGAVPEDALLG